MTQYYECKIRYEKLMEDGTNKKVTEKYLVDALSFTETESRIIEEMTPFISDEFSVSDIKKTDYSELFFSDNSEDDRYFKCKLQFITLDKKTCKEKRTSTNVLVHASDLRKAIKNLDEGMKGTMADYVIASVAETAIMDVYQYEAKQEADNTPNEVSRFINSLPEGQVTTITIGGKEVIVDKTGKNTKVKLNDDKG